MYEMQSAAGRGGTGEGKSDQSLHTVSLERTGQHRTPHALATTSVPAARHAVSHPHSTQRTTRHHTPPTRHPHANCTSPLVQAHTPCVDPLVLAVIIVITSGRPRGVRSCPEPPHCLHLETRRTGIMTLWELQHREEKPLSQGLTEPQQF